MSASASASASADVAELFTPPATPDIPELPRFDLAKAPTRVTHFIVTDVGTEMQVSTWSSALGVILVSGLLPEVTLRVGQYASAYANARTWSETLEAIQMSNPGIDKAVLEQLDGTCVAFLHTLAMRFDGVACTPLTGADAGVLTVCMRVVRQDLADHRTPPRTPARVRGGATTAPPAPQRLAAHARRPRAHTEGRQLEFSSDDDDDDDDDLEQDWDATDPGIDVDFVLDGISVASGQA